MADSNIPITTGAGATVDTRTSPDGDHRQVMVVGSPTTADVAAVSAAGALLVQPLSPPSARTTGNVTTASTTVGPVDVTNYDLVTITIRGTHAGINLTFEVTDDGTNWFPIIASRDDVMTAATTSGVITTNASANWSVAVGGYTGFRVRSTAYTSGTGVVGITANALPYDPVAVVGVSGTVTVAGSLTSAGTVTATPVTATGVIGFVTTATTNATSSKTSAGNLHELTISNLTAATIYVKLFNKASAPTLGTDTPVMVIPVAAGAYLAQEFGPVGKRFTTGIALAVTGAAASLDATAVAAGALVHGTYI